MGEIGIVDRKAYKYFLNTEHTVYMELFQCVSNCLAERNSICSEKVFVICTHSMLLNDCDTINPSRRKCPTTGETHGTIVLVKDCDRPTVYLCTITVCEVRYSFITNTQT